MDTMSKLSEQWLMYMDGKLTTKELIEEYEARGFDCNQDIPGNYYWEELYNALGPDTKVILTVRDSTERKRMATSTFVTDVGDWFLRLKRSQPNDSATNICKLKTVSRLPR